MGNRKALVLFSGGLDSATTLSHALKEGYDCSALTIDGPPENSSAIERAPGARSKSDEFSEVRMAIQMLILLLCADRAK